MRSTFLYALGGISIGVETEFQHSLKGFGATEERNFICSADYEKYSVADGDIHVRFAPFRQESSHKPINRIFSQELSEFYAAATSYLQFFYLTSAKKDLVWTLAIDREFSQFDYSVFLNNIETRDSVFNPFHLAVRLFLLQHSFINRQGLIIHAAGGAIQGKGMVFAAPSGTGKSTLCRLLQQSSYNRLFSEERLIVRSMNQQWHVWGTPWHGEGNIARNESAPLSAIIFLKQSQRTKITQLSSSDGLHRLIQTASIPWYSEEWTDKGLALCESLILDIPMFELAFRPDQAAVEAVEHLAAVL
ncbi:MAG: hypothetical protein WBM35_00135 [Candidatus Electrothrix sp.]